jgi:hypothetical protein
MKLSKKQFAILLLVAVFLSSFTAVFLAIFLTQSAYSNPSQYQLSLDGMDIMLGPPPNSTNIRLDTTITIDAVATADIIDLRLTPEVPIASVASHTTGILTYVTTFYPAKLLNPGTSYNVSATVSDKPVSWSFTTTSEPFDPGIGFYLATNVLWIALAAATSATAVAGFAVWYNRRA